ncbi:type II toxin-antitoxin system RelE/ParE family toxin [Mesorhizobium sp. M1066]|uniref:Type II toxin-antitoxin system RelE/ParE family toxin n=1 Tax=Mesorhizobium opportunistum TaxID=593909 RepID=A0ABV1YJB6_9HYPH
MTWEVVFGDEFGGEFEALPQTVQDELLASAKLSVRSGPSWGDHMTDTLNDSSCANMKELRFDADDGVRRVAFAFDPKRKAILLVAGDKSGVSDKRFYKSLIAKRTSYQGHLDRLAAAKKEKK